MLLENFPYDTKTYFDEDNFRAARIFALQEISYVHFEYLITAI